MSDTDDNAPDFSNVDWDIEQKKQAIKSGPISKVNIVSDLLGTIRSTKDLDGVKKKLKLAGSKKKTVKTLDVPLHKQAQSRIQSAVAYGETKKDLRVWNQVVTENRVAEQIVYPINKDEVELLKVERASDKAQAFKPRTEFEKQMAEILGKSKNNLTNDTEYTEAEMEILKAMSLKEAKEKTAQLQKLRKLTSFQEAKFRRQAKIKSKAYHRIKKRQKRRETIKDFEELLAKDPEAAKEKLEQLETDRAYERAVLRHRGQNKFSKELRQFASRNPEIKAVLADHLKFHRELKEKHGDGAFSSSDDDEDNTPKLTLEEILKMAANQAAKEVAETPKEIETVEKNPWLKGAVSKLRSQKAAIREKVIVREPTEPEFEVDSEFTIPLTKIVVEQKKAELQAAAEKKKQLELQKVGTESNEKSSGSEAEDEDEESEEGEVEPEPPKVEKQSKQLKRKAPEVIDYKNVEINSLFASVEEELKKADADESKGKKKGGAPVPTKKPKKVEKKKEPINEKDPEHEIDLKTFLEVNNIVSSELPENIDECLDNDDEEVERDNLLAEAFADDDVVGEFEKKKQLVEEEENPIEEETDITTMGWGSWTGPGIEPKKTKSKEPKPKPKREDNKKAHVIIRENAKSTIEELQPQYVPFPFTRPADFEAVIQQPIGRDWNPTKHTAVMTRPEVVAPAGRIIKPFNRSVLDMKTAKEVEDEEDE
ncbi:hypothetical protein FO519_000461 [Halicephalobus sp. NKZ332]|nr:hypothetical protein FO519_000461 [Halicephalobus sp. NKZ332]